jgi:hypothetical protein
MQRIRESVKAVHQRRQRQWMWQCVSWGLVASGIVGCLIAVARMASEGSFPILWIVGCVAVGPLVGLVYSMTRPCRIQQAAVAIDQSCGLKDRVGTAVDFINKKVDSPIHQLQIDDAEERVASIKPENVAPIVAPRSWAVGLSFAVLALVIGVFSGPTSEVVAAAVANNVVASQALRVENSLEELKKFNEEDLDPEIKQLLKELAEKIDELKQAEVDPKEALAKLSEMEAALHEQQEKMNQQDLEATLQEIGKAISLDESLNAAGNAMAESKMDEAAEELEKLDMPKLDQKTEKAIKEKLEKAMQNASEGAQKQLKSAVTKMSEGMCSGDRSKFQEGAEGLAGECKKQGRRKKLSDLLRKQCQCLSECKGECECECKSVANSKKKGGNNWGLGSSGNDPGDKTGMLKTGPQMQITGKESDSGDVDVETIKSNEQKQEAVRQYRQKSETYEQLTESVLSSEPIPLGHRQTIRRYFEMIRPQGNETEQVIKSTESDGNESTSSQNE